MNLTKEMKTLMAYCYVRDAAHHYEYVLDKRDGHQAVRLFLSELQYLYLEVTDEEDIIRVTHYEVVKSYYYPSPRCGYLNKYFKKYRAGNYNGASIALVPLGNLIQILETIDATSVYSAMSDSSNRATNPYISIRRATGRF